MNHCLARAAVLRRLAAQNLELGSHDVSEFLWQQKRIWVPACWVAFALWILLLLGSLHALVTLVSWTTSSHDQALLDSNLVEAHVISAPCFSPGFYIRLQKCRFNHQMQQLPQFSNLAVQDATELTIGKSTVSPGRVRES